MNPDIVKEVLYYEKLSLPIALLTLVIAFMLGAVHALGPGHGKSLMAAYLIGSTGRVKDAVTLAITITISHVFSVIVMGLIALWLMDLFLPEKMGVWLGIFSGVAIIAIGVWLFIERYKDLRQKTHHNNLIHKHHQHFHSTSSIQTNIALGISSGIVPCPKAIVILLLAISLQKIALGIMIIIVFSLGISIVLVSLGIIMVKSSHLLKGRFKDSRIQMLSIIGALVIIGLGIFMTIRTMLIL